MGMIILLIAIVLLGIFLVFWILWKRKWRDFSGKEMEYIESNWIRIIDSFNSNPKGAIIEADKILDHCLYKRGFKGSLGDKLKKAGGKFSNLDGVWFAHKLRNKYAHELNVKVHNDEARNALKYYKQALIDLGAKL